MLLSITLDGYVPLGTSGIQTVELSTNHIINLFISVNGAGKTSVMKEMNPLVPDKKNYKEGGSKKTEWQLGTNHFKLESYPYKDNGHSFLMNGEELNKNGTGQYQKDLVQAHFRLNTNLNRVLSGLRASDLLTTMEPTRRKDILMQIYPNDTESALTVYNKLRIERNSLRGAIKNQIARYTEENRKLQDINDCGVEELESRIKLIEVELRQSLLVRGGLEGVAVDKDLQRKIDDFGLLVDRLTVNKLSHVIYTRDEIEFTIENVTSFLNLHQEQAGVLKRTIAEHAGVLDGLEEFLADPEIFKVQAAHVKNDLVSVNEELDDYTNLLSQYPVFNDDGIGKENLELVETNFVAFLGRVTVASDPGLNGATYKGYTQLYEELGVSHRHYSGVLTDLTHKLKHFDSAENISCPDCTHEFKLGVTPVELGAMRDQQTALVTRIEHLEAEQKSLKDKIDNDADWYLSMNQLFGFIRENNHVHVLSILVKEYDIGKTDANRLLNALQTYMARFNLLEKKDGLLKEQNLLESRIGLLDRNNALDVAIYLAATEKELVIENNLITHFKDRLDSLNRTLNDINTYNRDIKRLSGLKHEIMQGLTNQGLAEFRVKVDERISILGNEKDAYMTSIIKNRSLTAVVTSISADINRLKRRLKIVGIAMDGLCPNKGLIGRLMGDFLKAICGNMNAIFQEIWNTPLYILPCAKENGDLTYKFPAIVGEGDPNPDITDCSAGERQIIDWAFRCVLLGYHPVAYPLFMDEIGNNLDEIKQSRFFNYVEEMTRSKSPRQMFMVSHFISTNGIFQDPNIIAMRYDGLTIPGEVNKNSLIM